MTTYTYSYLQVTVNGVMVQTVLDQGSASAIAGDLVSAVNGSSLPVTASLQSSTVVLLTSKTPGPVAYSLSATTCGYTAVNTNGAWSYSGACPSNTLSVSASSSVTGGKGAPTVSLSCSPNPLAYNVNTTCTASVSGSGPTPTGTVTFLANGGSWTSAGLNGSGQASATGWAGWAPGTYSATANYSGDGNFFAGSGGTSLTITTAASSTSLSSSLNPSAYGSPTTFTASVSPSSATGTVAFKDGGATLATVTLSGGTATFATSALAASSHSITAVYSGNTDYSGSTGALTQNVNQAALTVTANNGSKTYGQTASYGAGSTAFTSSGLQNGETIGSVTLTASGGTAANAAAGSYSLTPSAATGGTFNPSNYAISYHAGTLTVGTAALSVTANNGSKTYGQAVSYGAGSTAFTSSGLQNGETIGSVTITASGGTAANAASGSYSLTPSAASGGTFNPGNYAISYHAGTLTVGTAALSITANNGSKTYGQAVSYGAGSTAFTSSGLQNGETIGSVTLTASGGTAANAAAGSYSLTPSAATGGTFNPSNYAISYQAGTLTVGAAALSITASNGSKTYGQTVSYGAGSTAFSSSGLQNGDTIGSVTLTASGGTAANAASGTYSLTPSAATGGTFNPSNYAISYQAGTLTVGAAALSITASNGSKTYGQTVSYGAGSTAFSSTGLQNGDTIGSVTLTASGGTAANAAAGSYSLTPSAATGGTFNPGNYAISYYPGTLTVGAAALSVTAGNGSKTYGQTASYGAGSTAFTSSGLQNGETIGSVTLTASGGTAANAAVGSYGLTASAATGGTFNPGNYAVSYYPGTLTVGPAALRITASNASKTYGQTVSYGAGSTAFTSSGLQNGETVGSVTITASGGLAANAAAGTYSLTPSAATGGTFNPGNYAISYYAGTLAVGQAQLSVIANNVAMTYGAGALPAFTASYSGFLNGDTTAVLSGAPSLSTTATASSPAGAYPITAGAGTLAAANYAFGFVNGTLTIATTPLTVTANSVISTYGTSPTLTVSYTGFVNLDTQAVLSGAPSLTTAATASSPVGTYSIVATQGTLSAPASYTLVFANGTLTVNKAQLRVTANNASMAYGSALPTLAPSYSGFVNGDTVAALSGAPSLTTTGTASSPAGTYPITAAQGTLAAANYSFTFSGGTLTVGKASLTVTSNASMTYGGTVPALTPSYSGFVNGDTAAVLSGAPGLSTTATASSPAGSYPITAAQGTLAAANYAFSFTAGTLTVGKAMLTVTANNAGMTYGAGSLPALSASYTGFANGDTAAVLSGAPSLSTTATASSPAGSYPITAAQGTLAAANYSFTFASGALTVNRAPLSVTANNASMTYGAGSLPVFSASYSGFVNGDTGAVLSGAPSLTTAASAGSSAGSYPITAAQGTLAAANYAFSFTAGTLTIGRAMLTVTANNASMTYGAPSLPTFSATYSGFANGDTAAVLSGAPSLSTTATASSPAGTYPITPASGSLSASSYSFSFAPGVLTVWSMPQSLPAGLMNTPYSATLSANGGVSPFAWSIAAGGLPAGLSLNGSTGVIAGTPTASGATAFTVQVRDSNGSVDSVALSLNIVNPLPVIATLTPSSGPAGSMVTLLGSQFGPGSGGTLYVSGAATASVQWSGNVIMFQIPPATPAGSVAVVVTTALGSSNTVTFTVPQQLTADQPCD
jgi:hypothetical protein